MFNLRDFIKKGLLAAVGNMADYQVILNAAGWHEKGVLTEEDLADINAAIEAQASEVTEDENMDGITIEDSDGHTSIQRCYPYEYISDTECKWKLLLKHDGYYEGTDSVSREIIVNIPSSSTYKSVTLIINESIY